MNLLILFFSKTVLVLLGPLLFHRILGPASPLLREASRNSDRNWVKSADRSIDQVGEYCYLKNTESSDPETKT